MAKFAIVFCMLLVASVAYADNSSEANRRMDAKLKKMCAENINRLFNMVLVPYEKIMASSPDKEATELAEYLYQVAGKTLYALRKEVVDPNIKMPYGGNSMSCSNDVAFKSYDVFYRTWSGLEELAGSLGLN